MKVTGDSRPNRDPLVAQENSGGEHSNKLVMDSSGIPAPFMLV